MIDFNIGLAPYLVAVGDGNRLVVWRSEYTQTTSNHYQQVLDYIIDNRMVLISTETITHIDMVGNVHQSHYGTPEARQLWLAAHQENTNE